MLRSSSQKHDVEQRARTQVQIITSENKDALAGGRDEIQVPDDEVKMKLINKQISLKDQKAAPHKKPMNK